VTFYLKQENPLSARHLTRYYASALLIIASLTIASHLLLTYVLQHNQGTAAIINISGRQRMLSQRIASLAAQYRLGDTTARAALVIATNDFATTELALSAASRADSDTNADALEIRDIYAAGPNPLDAEAIGFVADARQIASLSPTDPAIAAPLDRVFAEARSPLLTKLNDIVAIHQSETERVLAELEDLQLAILGTVLLTLTIEALMIFRPMIRRIVLYTAEITRLATTDPLTELPNRRGFLERCEVERIRAQRHSSPLCLLMLDADRFKHINDTYGHEAGDEILRSMVVTFRKVLREGDFAGRLGGEEFAILAPGTDLPSAALLAERLRAEVASQTVVFQGERIKVTVSIGVTPVLTDAVGISRALHDADLLMYRAKHSGRNRVVNAEPTSLVDKITHLSP
jgi:diguanylate cyclase (GGDEF)-like protein